MATFAVRGLGRDDDGSPASKFRESNNHGTNICLVSGFKKDIRS